MANKLYAMELLTEEVAKDVAANPQEWMRFLNTASRLYRYTFPEQLLIYAQRPGATAVASMEIWNQKMYRWIKKGSKGIALIDNTSGPKTKLRYVFDVQDTYKVKNLGRDPQLWNLNPEGEQLVADYLQERLALEATEGGLAEVLHQAAEESVQAWLPDAFDELQMDVAGTFLEDLDEQNQKVEFRELMTNSVWYVLLNRCGLDVQEYLDAEDFRHITDFNQLKVIGHLGSSVNEISRPVLMQIGRYVLNDLEKDLKTVAKEKEVAYNEFNTLIRESKTRNTEDRGENKEETEHERDHLQPEWRVPDSGYQSGGDERNDREVRIDEERVSEKPQSSQIQHSDLTEPSGQSSDGNRQPGKAESRQPDVRTSGEKPGTGQNGRRDGMDQTHEPDQSTGRGTGNSGDYLQLSLFPTEEEQLGEIRKAAAALEQPAAFLISDEVVDDILRTGSGQKNTLFHITARLIEGLDNEEMQNFLKEEYETGGKGFTIDGQKISIWYDNDGIRIRRGDSARRNFDRMVTWEEAADRIRDMYEDRSYVDNLISNNAIEQEQEEMTNLLALHFRDTSRNREEQQSYSDWQDVVREAWTDSAEADAIAHRFEWLQKDMDENPEDYRRWEIQHNPEYFQRFQDLQRERSWVDQKFTVERPALSFITQDLKQLMNEENGIIDVFEGALETMEHCSCNDDPQKDGCYKCLYAYRQSQHIGEISRDSAITLLKTILSGKENRTEIKKLAQVDTNHLFDSELEREFVGAFEKLSTAERPIRIHKTLVNEKEGYSLQVGESLWTIEPQVDFDASMGISVKSRPDFVIRPKRTTGNQKPIAVFTDGYYYHKDIVEEDTLKRMAIILSRKYRVWSLTYKDVHNVFKSQGDYRTETLNSVKMPSGKVYKPAVKSANAEFINPEKENGFELLIDYLSIPNAEDLFATHARSFAMSIVDATQMRNQVLYGEWSSKWKSVLNAIGSLDDVDDFGQAIFGTWRPRQDMGNIDVLAEVSLAEMTGMRMGAPLKIVAIIDDVPDSRTDKYESDWNGFWHFVNVMQFNSTAVFLSKLGISKAIYSNLGTIIAEADAPEVALGTDVVVDEKWNDIMDDFIDDIAITCATEMHNNGIPAPSVVGFELSDEASGATIAEAEMAWEDKKIVWLLPEQEDYMDVFKDKGWTVLLSSEEININVFGGTVNE